jgi:OmcA/MtrC family decaheme c-type cytochrome
VTIQQGNPAYPVAVGIFDFVPGGGAGARREIVATAKCNECHEQITGHEGTRVDTRLCVTCHNPGSSVATPSQPNVTVDFKVMIHKIHYNNAGAAVPSVVVGTPLVAALPSVIAGTPYVVGDTNFSARRPAGVTFTQDARNCTKCHDGTAGAPNATTQGDNWKNAPNMDACSSCHDDVFFGTIPDPAKPYQTVPHPGGVMTDNSTCALCHGAGRFTDAKDIVVAHSFPTRLAAATAKFKYNINSVTVNASRQPVINFSVTDPTNANAPYDIKTAAPFTATASGASTLTVKFGWSTSEFINDGRAFGQAVSINLLNNAAVVAGATPGTFTVTSTIAIPATQTGTLRALMEGHPAGDVDGTGTLSDKLRVKSVFKDFVISGTVTPRRLVVDVAKCDVCHGVLSWHDNGRNDEPGICVVCHNPNATDSSQRPGVAGVDGKLEESIDFKTMIHAIHAGQADKGGFRTQGITVYGSDGPNDFTSVIFPAKLPGKPNNCAMCHIGTSYQLTGPFWDAPTAKGILGTTISSGASPTDPADNLRITPIASVCSSCHDNAVAKIHMQDAFNAGLFGVTQAVINAATPEACAFCHGPGRVEDVQVVHGVR